MKTLNYMNLAKYLLKLEKTAYKKCSKEKIDVKDKGSHDLLTTLDTSLEEFIIKNLNKNFPNVKIVSEEFNSSEKASGTYFVIDPVDGTINFANGICLWGIQIAFIENDVTVASAIYSPALGEYMAAKGFSAYKNNKKFTITPKDAIHSLTCLDIDDFEFEYALTKSLRDKILKFRILGVCCINCIFMAEGCYGAFIQFDPNPWDILPGLLLIQEAGGLHEFVDGYHLFASKSETMEILKKSIKASTKKLNPSKTNKTSKKNESKNS